MLVSISSSLFLRRHPVSSSFFFFNDTATTEIYTLSLHDALPIYHEQSRGRQIRTERAEHVLEGRDHEKHDDGHDDEGHNDRSEEHTSELQSHLNLVCRLLLEKKKKKQK